jgi:hypothetical protein
LRALVLVALLGGCTTEVTQVFVVSEDAATETTPDGVTEAEPPDQPETSQADTAIADVRRVDGGSDTAKADTTVPPDTVPPDTVPPDTVPPDTATADTAPACVPYTKDFACREDHSFLEYCGLASDGCGSKVQCNPCASGRCVRGGAVDAGHFFDDTVGYCGGACQAATPWIACATATGTEGHAYDCRPSWSPISTSCVARVRPSPDAPNDYTGWCCPKTGAEW